MHPSSVEGVERTKAAKLIPIEIGGQSGERSLRAVKRQIYSLNRLLNGIPTHKLVSGGALESPRIVLMRHSTNHLVLPVIENLSIEYALSMRYAGLALAI
jgi:hypothetical protein